MKILRRVRTMVRADAIVSERAVLVIRDDRGLRYDVVAMRWVANGVSEVTIASVEKWCEG